MLINQEIIEIVDNISLSYFKKIGVEEIENYIKTYNEETEKVFNTQHLKNISKLIEIANEKKLTDIGYAIVYKLYRLIKLLEKENIQDLNCDEKCYKEKLVFNLKKDLIIEPEKLTV